jgi:hypothetical protein
LDRLNPLDQRNWGVLKHEIVQAVLKFFDTGQMLEGSNDTSIVLIPKVDNPVDLKDLLYKIISKCLVNRLRPILGDVISENQSAFVPGRLIRDNASILWSMRLVQIIFYAYTNLICQRLMIVLSGFSGGGDASDGLLSPVDAMDNVVRDDNEVHCKI